MSELCPECNIELDVLDTITKTNSGEILCVLFVCHNEDCNEYGNIWNDDGEELAPGDPYGFY